MSSVGQREKETQGRVIKFFTEELKYKYLGDWTKRENNRNIEETLLTEYLAKKGYSDTLIKKTLHDLSRSAAIGDGKNLYDANKVVYSKLRYGVKVKEGVGQQMETVWLIDWKNPEENNFAIAEEVSIRGENKKRPDIVIYVNGIALGVIELKRSLVSVSEGIRQNLDNQKKTFIRPFFTTMQLVMAGNDTEGLKYGTIETPEKYFLTWKEYGNPHIDKILDHHLNCVCRKDRFLEIIHDFTVFDAGVKKVPRHNQYFGVKLAQDRIGRREGGIIWHTQGSGKSITMVWLAKWIRESVHDARVLIVTDRTELDEQIEKVFFGVDEQIVRIQNGKVKEKTYSSGGEALLATLQANEDWLMCALVHKFGGESDSEVDEFVKELKKKSGEITIPGNMFVFVDECHRTQSGKLHEAMTLILPDALFIGFTGTPLLKKDKRKSIEVFGSYIHTYKFNEAVSDGVVLDLRYEARDIDQQTTSQGKIDQWFEAKTRGLSDMARLQIKQKWATIKKVLSSQSRLEKIVNDILFDMETKPRLMDGRGNAMLVCSSIYQACKTFELFSKTDFKGKCAIVTSYQPSPADIKGEETGEGYTEKLHQYDIYRKMLAEYFDLPEQEAMNKAEDFEKQVKTKFIKEPGQMRLLIVVDKLLTGFDAPSATYLYIDKQMRDHALFQAICRVNRLDGDDKEYGYIVDYKDLFYNIKGAVTDYTSGALDNFDQEDVKGLLEDRITKATINLESAREAIKALCEPVARPKETSDYLHYFCAADTSDKFTLRENEPKRVTLYKLNASLMRAYANIAGEMEKAGYLEPEFKEIKDEVVHYELVTREVKLASGDYIDVKLYEPAMRHLLDSYIEAKDSRVISALEDVGLVDLTNLGESEGKTKKASQPRSKQDEKTMAEAIENNVRKIITDESPTNPKYYEKMSELLDALIKERRSDAIDYEKYLNKIKELVANVKQPGGSDHYPASMDTKALQALYDNLKHDEGLAIRIDQAVRDTMQDSWRGHRIKERSIMFAISEVLEGYSAEDIERIFEIIKAQSDY